jgi:hypothetical protein
MGQRLSAVLSAVNKVRRWCHPNDLSSKNTIDPSSTEENPVESMYQDCLFLTIPQELRDQILAEALAADVMPNSVPRYEDWPQNIPGCRVLETKYGPNNWTILFPEQAINVTYMSLLLACRQLRNEIERLFRRPQILRSRTAKLTIDLKINTHGDIELFSDEHLALTAWACLPLPPSQIESLDVLLKPCDTSVDSDLSWYCSTQLHLELPQLLFEILRRYIHFGPQLSRQQALGRALTLRTVNISIEDDPLAVRDRGRYKSLLWQLKTLAETGLMFGSIGAVDVRIDKRRYFTPVASVVQDESLLRSLHECIREGFKWGVDDEMRRFVRLRAYLCRRILDHCASGHPSGQGYLSKKTGPPCHFYSKTKSI